MKPKYQHPEPATQPRHTQQPNPDPQSLPIPTNSPNPRQTPPFLQFQTVRQSLRIQLPSEEGGTARDVDIKDMEYINKHYNGIQQFLRFVKNSKAKKAERSENDRVREKKGVHGVDVNINMKKKKNKVEQISSKVNNSNSRDNYCQIGQKSISQFSEGKIPYKKRAKKSKQWNTISNNNNKSKQKNTKKSKTRQKNPLKLPIQQNPVKDPKKAPKSNIFNPYSQKMPLSRQQTLKLQSQPYTARQVHKIHKNRSKHNQSYNINMEQKQKQGKKEFKHRRRISEEFGKGKVGGSASVNLYGDGVGVSGNVSVRRNDSKYNDVNKSQTYRVKLTDHCINEQVLKSGSLSSLDYYKLNTQANDNFSSQQQSSNSSPAQRSQPANISKSPTSQPPQQLHSRLKLKPKTSHQGYPHTFNTYHYFKQYQKQEEFIDSDDWQLMTRISNDRNVYGGAERDSDAGGEAEIGQCRGVNNPYWFEIESFSQGNSNPNKQYSDLSKNRVHINDIINKQSLSNIRSQMEQPINLPLSNLPNTLNPPSPQPSNFAPTPHSPSSSPSPRHACPSPPTPPPKKPNPIPKIQIVEVNSEEKLITVSELENNYYHVHNPVVSEIEPIGSKDNIFSVGSGGEFGVGAIGGVGGSGGYFRGIGNIDSVSEIINNNKETQLISKINTILTQIDKLTHPSLGKPNLNKTTSLQCQVEPQPQKLQEFGDMLYSYEKIKPGANSNSHTKPNPNAHPSSYANLVPKQQVSDGSSSLGVGGWERQTTVGELQIILDNCISDYTNKHADIDNPNTNSMHSNDSIIHKITKPAPTNPSPPSNSNSKPIQKPQSAQHPNMFKNMNINSEQKWTSQQISNIKKAKKMLLIGFTQATKLLSMPIPELRTIVDRKIDGTPSREDQQPCEDQAVGKSKEHEHKDEAKNKGKGTMLYHQFLENTALLLSPKPIANLDKELNRKNIINNRKESSKQFNKKQTNLKNPIKKIRQKCNSMINLPLCPISLQPPDTFIAPKPHSRPPNNTRKPKRSSNSKQQHPQVKIQGSAKPQTESQTPNLGDKEETNLGYELEFNEIDDQYNTYFDIDEDQVEGQAAKIEIYDNLDQENQQTESQKDYQQSVQAEKLKKIYSRYNSRNKRQQHKQEQQQTQAQKSKNVQKYSSPINLFNQPQSEPTPSSPIHPPSQFQPDLQPKPKPKPDSTHACTNLAQKLQKAISSQDIEQIIEFIMLDLYIEVVEEVEINFPEERCLFEVLKARVGRFRGRKLGFGNGVKDVCLFLQAFGAYLEDTVDKPIEKENDKEKEKKKDKQKDKERNNVQQGKQLQSSLTLKQTLYTRIQQPIGPKPTQLLKFMRDSQDQYFYIPLQKRQNQDQSKDRPINKNEKLKQQQSEDSDSDRETFALCLNWFHQFSQKYVNQYDFGIYYVSDQDRETKRQSFLRNAMHIHNKAIFDSINQTIDRHRPYGIIGQPFPWKAHPKPTIAPYCDFHKTLNKTFEQVSQNCRYLCGFFPQQHLTQGHKLLQAEYEQFSEDRLNRLLHNHLKENQIRWHFMDDEETEILMEIGGFLFAGLIKEVIGDILGMKMRGVAAQQ